MYDEANPDDYRPPEIDQLIDCVASMIESPHLSGTVMGVVKEIDDAGNPGYSVYEHVLLDGRVVKSTRVKEPQPYVQSAYIAMHDVARIMYQRLNL